jgi:hypothetical protein
MLHYALYNCAVFRYPSRGKTVASSTTEPVRIRVFSIALMFAGYALLWATLVSSLARFAVETADVVWVVVAICFVSLGALRAKRNRLLRLGLTSLVSCLVPLYMCITLLLYQGASWEGFKNEASFHQLGWRLLGPLVAWVVCAGLLIFVAYRRR